MQSLYVWQIIVGPLVALVAGSAFFAAVCFQGKGVQHALIPSLAVLCFAATFKLYRVIHTNDLLTHDQTI